MKSIVGILSFDPNTDAAASFRYLGNDVITPPIVWSHNTLDPGRHIGNLAGTFTAGTTGRTGTFTAGNAMTIDGSADTNDVIVQLWDKDGVEYEAGFSTLIEIIIL
jgi:hypothetical protein